MQADSNNNLIRRIDLSSGTVTTLAGTAGTTGHADGFGTTATFNKPSGIAMDAAGSFALVVSGGRKNSTESM